jgi:hypothetical protein
MRDRRGFGIPVGEPVYEVLRTAIDAEGRKVETCANVLAAKHRIWAQLF